MPEGLHMAIDLSPEAVKAARHAAGMTQGEAAALVHLSRWQTWSEYENGKRPADPARLHLFLILTRQAKIPRKIPQRSTVGEG
jgi:DNA-binding transcriptional regulator YiaG